MSRNHRLGRPLLIEGLETRRTFAADLNHGVLSISGTPHDDVIEVTTSKTSLTVTVNDSSKSFDLSSVKSLLIHAGGGEDTVRLANSIILSTRIFGDGGNDILHGGSG